MGNAAQGGVVILFTRAGKQFEATGGPLAKQADETHDHLAADIFFQYFEDARIQGGRAAV